MIPVGESHAAAGAERSSRDYAEPASASIWTIATSRSAGASATPSWRRSHVPVVYGDKESADDLALRERGGGQSRKSLRELVIELTPLASPPGS